MNSMPVGMLEHQKMTDLAEVEMDFHSPGIIQSRLVTVSGVESCSVLCMRWSGSCAEYAYVNVPTG